MGPGGEEYYGYDGGNRRIYVSKLATNGSGAIEQEILTWWSGGKRAGRYEMVWSGTGTAVTLTFRTLDTSVWFGGKPLKLGAETGVVADRLGTIRRGAGKDYFPYGMENAASQTAGDKEKYATYMQDGRTDLAYADQRYYATGAGRFMTADPAGDGLNWYAYVGGDPVNGSDPSGLRLDIEVLTGNTICLYDANDGQRPIIGCAGPGARFSGLPLLQPSHQPLFSSTSGPTLTTPPPSPAPGGGGGAGGAVNGSSLEAPPPGDAPPGFDYDAYLTSYYSQFQAEQCSTAQYISTPADCGGAGAMAASTMLFRILRNLGIAQQLAVNLVGQYGQWRVGQFLNLTANTGANEVRFLINSVYRTPDFVNRVSRVAYEVKYVGEFRVTQQIIDTAQAAQSNGYSCTIYLYQGASISTHSQNLLHQTGVTLVRF